MYMQVKEIKGNKSRAISNSVEQMKNNNKKGFGFMVNRPETVFQRRLQEIVNNKETDNKVIQKLSKAQRQNISKYTLTKGFKDKHVCADASRATLMEVAERRGVSASTIIRASASTIEAKAKEICLSGDDKQVAAERNQHGKQIKVRMTGLDRATIKHGEFQGWNTDPFVIVGTWDKKEVNGNHFQADDKVGENDEEILG